MGKRPQRVEDSGKGRETSRHGEFLYIYGGEGGVEAERVPREGSCAIVSGVSSFGRDRGMESFRTNLGLPVPRIAIRQVRESAQWAGHYESSTSGRAAGALILLLLDKGFVIVLIGLWVRRRALRQIPR